tara:strand:+ start:5599 stop:6573 length:975 start_codon:yes stop_codon:yes gene_type:complete
MGNKRVFYACQGLSLDGRPLYGVQNLSIRTDHNTNVVENWGQLAISGVYADTPKANISFSRILGSGNPDTHKREGNGIYGPAITGSLTGICANHGRKLCVFFTADTEEGIGDNSVGNVVGFKDVSVNSISYSINVDGFLTEDVQMIAYHKMNDTGLCDFSSLDFINGSPPSGVKGVPIRRQHIQSFSVGEKAPSGAVITDLNITIPFNIQTVEEFGTAFSKHSNRYRYATFPIVSNYSVTALYQNTPEFDNYLFSESGIACDIIENLPQQENLSVSVCNNTMDIDLGHCILQSVDYGGGDTGGGNATLTYNYNCYNSGLITGND